MSKLLPFTISWPICDVLDWYIARKTLREEATDRAWLALCNRAVDVGESEQYFVLDDLAGDMVLTEVTFAQNDLVSVTISDKRDHVDIAVFLRLVEWLNLHSPPGADEIRAKALWFGGEEDLLRELKIGEYLSPWQVGVLWYWARQKPDYDQVLVPFIETMNNELGLDVYVEYVLEHYLTVRDGCVPDGYEENLSQNIINMFYYFYWTAMKLAIPQGFECDVIVEPSIEDTSQIVCLVWPYSDSRDKTFVADRSIKAWRFWWSDLNDMAGEIESIASQTKDVIKTLKGG